MATLLASVPDRFSGLFAFFLAFEWSGEGLRETLTSFVNSQDRAIQLAVIIMCIAVYIITRGKWRK